ncbi:proprotein convertase P-domain-containing protein [Candidatus Amarobacter glycogenicus]|uniref:proprotein convertase P-domain-containing protein n=1 Tax=Candidatus Amarobacter glycogenicus TaxID=3140699 RepID=UPI002A0B4471|nr:proprotein convertase P-domain-containing protein [Dehalococcoidia bacterium]
MTGTTSSATDAGWFSLALNAGDTIYASLDLDPTRDNTQWNGSLGIGLFSNYYLTVNDVTAGSATNPTSEAHFMTVRETGTYYIWVGVPAGGTTFGDYNLSVSVHPAAPETCTTYTSTDVPQTLGPGATTASSTITVPGNPRIADLNVTVELTHTVMTELDVTLMAPGGNEVGLFTDVGQSTAGVFVTMTTTLDDEAAIPIAVYLLQPGPAFEPEYVYRLDWFDGQDAGGAWTLKLTDDTANTNGGTLLGWSMRVCEPTPPPVCPGGTTPVTVYSSDFEATDGGFTHSGTADTWAWGSPTAAPINTCNGGVNCWKTNLTGLYNVSSNQDLVSPNISLAGLVGPVVVTWSQKYQIESASFDHAYVDFREVGGANPSRLWEWYGATMTTGVGAVTIQESAGWGTRQRDLSSYAGLNTELVFHLDTDSSGQYAGLAVDDVSVTACQPAGATFTPTVTPTVTPTPTDTPTPTNTPTATPVPAGFTCSTPNVAIPDNNPTGVSDTLNVGSTGTLNDVNVFVRATHTWVGDTSFTVTHNATSVTVIDRPGVPLSTFGCSGDNITATLDDEAATPVEDECAASVPTINGTFIPNNALSAFDGMDQSGAWTITAVDAAGGDTGVLVEWCVQTETSVPPTATPTDTATPEPLTATPTDTATPEATPTDTGLLSRRPPQPTLRLLSRRRPRRPTRPGRPRRRRPTPPPPSWASSRRCRRFAPRPRWTSPTTPRSPLRPPQPRGVLHADRGRRSAVSVGHQPDHAHQSHQQRQPGHHPAIAAGHDRHVSAPITAAPTTMASPARCGMTTPTPAARCRT